MPRVIRSGSVRFRIRRGIRFSNQEGANAASVVKACDGLGLEPTLPNGSCYTPRPDSAETGTDEILDRDLVVALEVTGAVPVGTSMGATIYEIPAASTATVALLSDPWDFLLPGGASYHETLGTLTHATVDVGIEWRRCIQDLNETCTRQVRVQETTQLTRVSVRPTPTVSLSARPGHAEATLRPATGTDVSSFAYTAHGWASFADGYSPL